VGCFLSLFLSSLQQQLTTRKELLMSSPGTARSRSTASDEARLEHIATECIAKAVNIVLASRLSSLQRGKRGTTQGGGVKDNRNRWFNLETEEVDSAISSLDAWKRDTSLTFVAEIYGEKKTTAGAKSSGNGMDDDGDGSFGAEEDSSHDENAHLLEAWTFQVQRQQVVGGFNVGNSVENSTSSSATSNGSSSGGSSSQTSQTRATRATRVHGQRLDTPLVYKRAVIFLRSLFCYVRLLPAFSVYQVTKRSSNSKLLITSKIKIVDSSSLRSSKAADDYGPDFSVHQFKQIDTPVGSICAQVAYVSNPVEVLSKEYGQSVMYTATASPNVPRTKNMAAAAVPIQTPNKGTSPGMSHSQLGGGAGGGGGGGFSPHSAPQVIRRQSWSFSRNQMQLEASVGNNKSKFSDVMVIDPVEEGHEEKDSSSPGQNTRQRQNTSSSPMLIPNAAGGGHTSSNRNNSSSNNQPSSGGATSNLSAQLRVKMSVSPQPRGSSMKALTAPGRSSTLTSKVYRTVSASPDECVVGFAMRHEMKDSKFSDEQFQSSSIAKMELPISALNQRKLEATSSVAAAAATSAGQSIVKTTPSSSVKSADSSDMSGYRMPLSCSPQLPFAMTPNLRNSAGSSLSYDFQASPLNSGSGIPSIRLVRRGTSPKDSSEMTPSFNSLSSFSPGQDNFLDSGIPCPPLYYGSYNKPKLGIAYPSSYSGTYEEEDQDALPFALETQNSPGESLGVGRGESQDAAIGAFVRTLQEAPPLRNLTPAVPACRTLSSAMLELRQLRETCDTARGLVSN
jgi:hypothetical protein